MQRPDPAWHEECLEHEGFVRRLAQSLVHDGHLAEDLVQDTMLAAMRRPTWTHSPRAWLATVTRRLAANVFRERDRRRYRESQVARSEVLEEGVPGETALALAQLGDAFQTLEEKYRTPLIQRYFEGHSSFEIGRRLDLPAATIRTRIRRGLELLRERLDRESGGQRAAWLAPLASWLQRGAPILGLTPMVRLAAGGLIVVSALVAWQWSTRAAPESGAVSPSEVAAASAGVVAAAGDESTSAEVPPVAAAADLEVRVLSRADRTPLAAVVVRLERSSAYAWAKNFREFTTDADGFVRVGELATGSWIVRPSLGAPRAFVKEAGVPLGLDLLVDPGRPVTGRAWLPSGAAAAGVRVHVSFPGEVDLTRVAGRTDEEGRFSVDGVSRDAWIGVRGPIAGDSLMHHLGSPTHEGSDVAHVTLRMSKPRTPLHGKVVDASGRSLERAHVRVGSAPSVAVQVIGRELVVDGASHWARTGEDGHFAIRGTNPNVSGHEIWVYRPGYGPLRVPRSGSAQIITLAAEVIVAGTVFEADGSPAVGAEVRAWQLAEPFLRKTTTDANGRYFIDALPHGDLRVRVQAHSGSALYAWQAAPGERAEWDAYLGEEAPIRGTLSDAAGRPLAGEQVFLTPMRRLSQFHSRVSSDASPPRSTRTDDNGQFAFYGCGNEGHLLSRVSPASAAPYPWCTVRDVLPSGPPVELQAEPSHEPSAYLSGRLVSTEGNVMGAGELLLDADRVDRPARLRVRADSSTGAFRLGPLPPGRYHLDAWTPGATLSTIGSFLLHSGEERDLGDVRPRPGGSLELSFASPPPAGYSVRLLGANGLSYSGRPADPLSPVEFRDGKALISDLPTGPYVVSVLAPECATFSRRVDVTSGEMLALAVELPPGASIAIEMQSPRDAAEFHMRALAQLSVKDETGVEIYTAQQVWRGGRNRLVHTAALAPGEYTCVVTTTVGYAGSAGFVVTGSDGRVSIQLE